MLICLNEPHITVIPGVRRTRGLFGVRIASFAGPPQIQAHVLRSEGGRPSQVFTDVDPESLNLRVVMGEAGRMDVYDSPLRARGDRWIETRFREAGLFEIVTHCGNGAGRVVILRAHEEEGNVVRVDFMIQEPEEPVTILAHRRLLAGEPESWPDPIRMVLQPLSWVSFRADLIAFSLLDAAELSIAAAKDLASRPNRFARLDREDD